ncbi:UbiA family prenyltransferase [Acinetobacter baumannii]|nr:UbiA family prenyltransferase [Acinetobacter baumannii]MDT1780190.1 UbiA family prenyltransferase [Acinetobacter baumannii]MDV4341286.1 UbiA family prenyltransferase [Acinetobacter baumannii]
MFVVLFTHRNFLLVIWSIIFSFHLSIYETLYQLTASFLGAAFSWSIPMAFTAVGKTPDLTCWLLYFGNLAWTVAYDTQYAITDREYDLKIGVKSTAILFGRYDIQIIALLQAISLVLIGTALYLENILFPWAIIALVVVAFDFIYQTIKTKDRNPQVCFWAFRHNRWVGLIIFLGIFLNFI